MKILRNLKFRPITIVIENKIEYDCLYEISRLTISIPNIFKDRGLSLEVEQFLLELHEKL